MCKLSFASTGPLQLQVLCKSWMQSEEAKQITPTKKSINEDISLLLSFLMNLALSVDLGACVYILH